MPAYPGNNLAKLLYENRQAFLFLAELVVAGEASHAYELRRERGASYPWGCSFQLSFSADPGAFEINIQVADTDVDTNYVTVATIDTAPGRFDMTNLWPKFVRAQVGSITNAVNVTLLVTR
jgi:hypothetical protein